MPDSKSRELRIATAGLVLACFFWGVGFPLTKAYALRAQTEAPGASGWFIVSSLVVGRFLVSALLLLTVERRRPTGLELEQGLWVGLFSGVGLVFQTDGMILTDASTSAFLTQGYVLVLPVVAAVLARRFPELRVVISVLAIVVGLAVLARFDPRTMQIGRGEWETLLAAMCFALQILWLARPKYGANRAGPVTLIFFVVIGVGTLPLALLSARAGDVARLAASPAIWLLFALLTVLGTLVPFTLMNRNQPRVPPAEAGVIYGAEPLFASMFALFLPELLLPLSAAPYPNEQLTPRLLLGGALVTFANIVLQVRGRAKPPSL